MRAPLNLGPLARFIQRWSTPLVLVLTVGSIVSAFGLRHFLQDPFEYDFRKLNAKLNTTEEAQAFCQSIDKLFGRWPSPTIVLGDSIDEVEPIRATIREQDAELPGPDVIGQITTVYDLLPGPPDLQKRKLALIAQIRKLTHDPALDVLDDKEREQITKVDPPPGLHELGPMDLPPIARRPFTEVDGTIGRVVLVYPAETGLSVWNGRDLLRIASVLQYLHLPTARCSRLGLGGGVRGDDPLDPPRRADRDGGVAHRRADHRGVTIRPARIALMALATLVLGVLWMVGAPAGGTCASPSSTSSRCRSPSASAPNTRSTC